MNDNNPNVLVEASLRSANNYSSGGGGARFRVIYLVALAVAFLAINYQLNHRASQAISELQHSTLFYAPTSKYDDQLASYTRSQLHLHLVNMLAPGSGKIVLKYMGVSKVLNPTIYVQAHHQAFYVAGNADVANYLRPYMDRQTPYAKSRVSLAIMFLLVLAACAFSDELLTIISLMPMVGTVVLGALWGSCAMCKIGGSVIEAVLPLLGLVYMAAAATLLSLDKYATRLNLVILAVASAILPFAQGVLLIFFPRLCPICLTVTFIAATSLFGLLQILNGTQRKLIVVNKPAAAVLLVIIFLLFTHDSLMAMGIVKVPSNETVQQVDLVGHPISQFVGDAVIPANELIVVTIPGCEVCSKAITYLNTAKLAYTQVSTCGYLESKGCFTDPGHTFPAPLFLMTNPKGQITFQHEGWFTESSSRDHFLSQISNLEGGAKF